MLKRYESDSILEVRVSNFGQDTSPSNFFIVSLPFKQTPRYEFKL